MGLTLDQVLQQAIQSHKAGMLQDAERLYRAILGIQPKHPDANHNLGVLVLGIGKPQEALPYLKTALEANRTQGQFWFSYINALTETKHFQEAKSVMEEGKKLGLSGPSVEELQKKISNQLRKFQSASEIGNPEGEHAYKAVKSKHNVQSTSRAPTQQEINKVLFSYNSGKLDLAEKQARSFIIKYPNHVFGWNILGAVLVQSCRKLDAIDCWKRGAELDPKNATLQSNLGVAFQELGRLGEAEVYSREAVRLKPDFAEAHSNLGNTLQELGSLCEAEACYREAIRLKPEFAEAHSNLGITLKELGRLREAEACYRETIRLKPNYAKAHSNLGIVLRDLGHQEKAEASYREAIRLKPDYVEAYSNLGITLQELGRLIEAETCYREAIRLKPDFAEAYANLGSALRDLGHFGEAESYYREAIRLKLDFAEAHSNLSVALRELGHLHKSEAYSREAIRLKPGYAEAYSNLGITVQELGRLSEAETCYRDAIFLKPDYVEAHSNLGNVLKDLGRLCEAEACYREAIRLKPDFARAHSNLLLTLNYKATLSTTEALIEARYYGAKVSAKAALKYSSWLTALDSNKIRVGFVSGDLRNHPVGYFIEGLLQHLDKTQFELYAFPTSPNVSDLTTRIKTHFQKWVPIFGKTDVEAAAAIHSLGVHILIDLSGHTANTRLPVFAYKPAPVQASWLGYFATTGLPEMDYIIGDPYVTPESEKSHFTESLWQLPESYLCFSSPHEKLVVGDLPAMSNGFVTFGCFNNLTKMNDAVVSVWAKILKALPDSKLFLKTKQLSDAKTVTNTKSRFGAHGISSERLILEGPAPRLQLLESYNRVDIALDPFPYPGGTTSAEALWMGVPVLTLKGDRFLSHLGESIAHNVEHSHWIAKSQEDYVDKAIKLSANIQMLASIRRDLRKQVLKSPLFDAERFAKNFEAAMKCMWEQRSL